MQIKQFVIDDFNYADGKSLEVDPNFPASVFYTVVQNEYLAAEGVCYFSFTGFKEELTFVLRLSKSELSCEYTQPKYK